MRCMTKPLVAGSTPHPLMEVLLSKETCVEAKQMLDPPALQAIGLARGKTGVNATM